MMICLKCHLLWEKFIKKIIWTLSKVQEGSNLVCFESMFIELSKENFQSKK